MKQESRIVYVADDGTIFDTKAACQAYEAEALKRQQALAGLKVWRVNHGFDETEGRGYFANTVIVTDQSEAVLIQWCLDNIGAPLESWYGDGYYETWKLIPQPIEHDVKWAMKVNGTSAGRGFIPMRLVVISNKDWTWAGLPPSEHPWRARGGK